MSTQEIICAFSPASPQFLRPSTDGLHAEQEHRKKRVSQGEAIPLRESSSLRNPFRTRLTMD